MVLREFEVRVSGWTLVEVLVIVAVTAILIGLFAPVFAHVRERARMCDCAANLRNIGAAYAVCATGDEGTMPLAYYTLKAGKDGEYTQVRSDADPIDPLFRHVAGMEFQCPSDESARTVPGGSGACHSSYAYNLFLPMVSTNISRVNRPVNIVTFYDGDLTTCESQEPFDLRMAQSAIRYRHNGRANFLYLDGHVENHGEFETEGLSINDWFSFYGVSASGLLNINPNNSASGANMEFELLMPDGRVLTRDDLQDGSPIIGAGFSSTELEYTGKAKQIKLRFKGALSKQTLNINDHLFQLPNNRRLLISGDSLDVHVYNAHVKNKKNEPMGHWWISFSSNTADVVVEEF